MGRLPNVVGNGRVRMLVPGPRDLPGGGLLLRSVTAFRVGFRLRLVASRTDESRRLTLERGPGK